ncbi:MAG: S41 family peptidase, partial [Lachnospiraceae bacterium]|nr:S41 family peptidase [Lachnospiraceae bacterium]
TLIGTTTFGKGIVQNVRQMEDGSAYKITVARYYTPNGDYIHGVGITPDVELEFEYLGDADTDYDELQDNQVLKAMEVLRGEVQ